MANIIRTIRTNREHKDPKTGAMHTVTILVVERCDKAANTRSYDVVEKGGFVDIRRESFHCADYYDISPRDPFCASVKADALATNWR